MTGHLDRYGDPLEEEDDDQPSVPPNGRSRDEIHRDRCAQFRAILREARERREAQR